MRSLLTGALLVAAAAAAAPVASAPLQAQLLNPQSHGNAQPSLALHQFIDQSGFVRTTAAFFVPAGTANLQGGTVPIQEAPLYASRVGATFGGDGASTVGIPDAVGRTIVGATPATPLGSIVGSEQVTLTTANFPASQGGSATPFDNRQPGVAMRYAIRTQGFFPSVGRPTSPGAGAIGAILPYAGLDGTLPPGWAFADGRLLPIAGNSALFSLLGTTYGGDGRTTFALPDLRGRTPIGTGNGIALGQVSGTNFTTLTNANVPGALGGGGVPVSNLQETLGLSFMIAQEGFYPPREGLTCPCDGFPLDEAPYLGEVTMFAWQPQVGALAGQQLRINQNVAFFSLLGFNFGGDGQQFFSLPDLRGRVVVGAGASLADPTRARFIGEQYGTESFLLVAAPTQVVPEPGTVVLTVAGLGGLAAVARRRTARRG